ncbi:MAG TPA: 3-dehydroquinate synthase [Acidobacteriaceae bacterium]
MPNQPQIVTVTAASATYDIHIGTGLLANLSTHIAALTKISRLFVVTSPEIWALHGPTLTASFTTEPTILQVPAGEQHKRLATVERLAEEMAHARADRDSILIAFGGGVIGDMTGFLAAIYMRGIRYIGVPTTLLAQVDSSLGGKTGCNLAAGKNLIGSFHHPLAVFADIDLLATLPAAELRAGLQESIKAGIIRDRALFDFLDTHSDAVLSGDPAALTEVVTASVRMKANVVAADEKETGERMLLNLGHTLGHAIESATNYTQLLHGEAVAWGMIAAIEMALNRRTITREQADRMTHLICRYGPLRPFKADAATLVANTAKDKKSRSGTRSFILPVGIGDAMIVRDVTDDELLPAAQGIVLTASGAVE